MRMITLYLPEPYIEALDKLVNEKYYPNRAEAIRTAILDMIREELWSRKSLKSARRKNGRRRSKRRRKIASKA
ncbi:MAG TPA: ribbon-helix-helix protein, CopG family [Candidatus Bathyarchaeota archaeon]|nr:ribbon-helix-helix protein, CopG family [Candidatus Bathyarchaeota archaeon]